MKNIKIGIVGGAGYTGGELIRILINHPNAELVFEIAKAIQESLFLQCILI